MKRVLIVDDSLYMRSLIKIALRKQPFEVVGEAGDGKTALEMLYEKVPDLVLLDNILPDMMGVDLLYKIRSSRYSPKVIMISQMKLGELFNRANSLGLDGYVAKPFETEDIINELNKV